MPSEQNRRRNPAPTEKKTKEASHSPFAGCSIIITATVVMLFLVGFTFWSLIRIDKEVAKFTEPSPSPTPTLDPSLLETEFNDLSARLDSFRAAVLAEEAAELTLTQEDLNLSIAAHPQFQELQKTFYISDLTPEAIKVQISYRMNGKPKPIGDGKPRYLNGIFTGRPRLDTGQLLIDIESIQSDTGTVPEEFAAHLSDHQITAPYLKDETLGPIMKKITSVELTHGALIIHSDPTIEPPGQKELTPADIDKTRKIALTAFGVVLGIFAVLLVAFLSFNKKKST